jgi:serine/threonine protein kinase
MTAETLGPYRLLRRLAIGGMGEIHLGERRESPDSERLAIKVLRADYSRNPALLQMFINEAKVVAALNHPGIVKVVDVGQASGRYFIAMEYVEGLPSSTLVRAIEMHGKRLSGDLLCQIGRALCSGLHHAHEQTDAQGQSLELIHRDVNPRNLLVSSSGEVKLIDFGIAKAKHLDSYTRPGTVKGTLEYLAPEQVKGGAPDRRVDVYGAAVTLYFLATLDSPFWRGSVQPTLSAITEDSLPDLRKTRPDLPLDLIEAIERAVIKDPAKRFATAADFMRAIPRPQDEAQGRAILGRLVTKFLADKNLHQTLEEEESFSEESEPTVLVRAPNVSKPPPPVPSMVDEMLTVDDEDIVGEVEETQVTALRRTGFPLPPLAVAFVVTALAAIAAILAAGPLS